MKECLIKSHRFRSRNHSADVATAEIEGVVKETNEGVLNRYTMRSCRDAACKMEDLLFSVGGAERIVTTL